MPERTGKRCSEHHRRQINNRWQCRIHRGLAYQASWSQRGLGVEYGGAVGLRGEATAEQPGDYINPSMKQFRFSILSPTVPHFRYFRTYFAHYKFFLPFWPSSPGPQTHKRPVSTPECATDNNSSRCCRVSNKLAAGQSVSVATCPVRRPEYHLSDRIT